MEKTEALRKAAENAIREKPRERVISFSFEGEKYWIKRKMSNGRNQLVKYSAEKEFYYEIARMDIAKSACPESVQAPVVLAPDYMVTRDGGETLTRWMEKDIPEEEKRELLRRAGAALCRFHQAGVVHGRPALRDIVCRDGQISFLDWENRLYSRDEKKQKILDFLLLLQTICRENYPEEKGRLDAAEQGYVEAGGRKIRDAAAEYLRHHAAVGRIAHNLARFHWKDVEPVRKLYDRFTGGSGSLVSLPDMTAARDSIRNLPGSLHQAVTARPGNPDHPAEDDVFHAGKKP